MKREREARHLAKAGLLARYGEWNGGVEQLPQAAPNELAAASLTVTAALAVSGLPSERFVFEGFLPRKPKARLRRLAEIGADSRTVVVFIAPSRAVGDLEDLAEACGADREVVMARELTKLHEEVWRGTLEGAVTHFSDSPPKGEITAVIAGAATERGDVMAAVVEVERLVGEGVSFSDAVRRSADMHAVRRRELYERARRQVSETS